MTWVAVAVAGGAVVSAVASKQSADAANKPKKNYTDQTTTQNPYMSGTINPAVQQALALQQGVTNRGAGQIVPDGHGGYTTVYQALPNAALPTDPGSPAPAGGGNSTGGGSGMKNQASSSGVPAGYVRRPDGRIVPAVAAKPGGGGGGGGGVATMPGGGASGPNVSSPDAIFRQTAAAGLQAGNDPTTKAAQQAAQGILASQAAGVKSGGTGFAGYNTVDDTLTKQLQGQVSGSQASNLLNQFLGQDGYSTSGAAGGGGGAAQPTPGQIAAQSRGIQYGAGGSAYSPAAQGGPGGIVPDAAGDGVFGTNIKALLGGQTDKADMQALLDKTQADSMKSYWQMAAQQDAAAQGGGRYGGSQAEFDKSYGQGETMRQIAGADAQTRYTDYNDQRTAALQALGLVNTRDLGAMNDATNRAQIAAQLAASGASSASAAATAKRGQDLNAIQSILQNQQYGEGQLAGLGGQLSGDEHQAISAAPGLASVAAQGLNEANSAGSGMIAQQNADTSRASVNQQGSLARAGMSLQVAGMNQGSDQTAVNNYLNTLLRVGGMGGTSTTQGTNVVAGLGVSPTGAALTGALGGASTGYGLYTLANGGY